MSNNNLPDLTEIVIEILGPYEDLLIPSGGISELVNGFRQKVEKEALKQTINEMRKTIARIESRIDRLTR